MKKQKWVARDTMLPAFVPLRCNFHTRVVVEGHRTPSGKRYDFGPGEEQPVNSQDMDYLLSLIYRQSNCCGGGTPADIKYFTEV